MRYLMLLRGINVGGHNRVVMKELRENLAAVGFTNVSSYINSGNLIFDSSHSQTDVTQMVQQLLAQNYIFPVTSLILSAQDYQQDFLTVPQWWGSDRELRHNALFLLPSFDRQSFARIQSQVGDYDQVAYTANIIFWTAPFKKDYSKSFYSKLMKESFYKDITIRNRNTALKLGNLLKNS
ncbi:DUF1697 domain-containing protein [Pediococcus inopinatus]|uniref:DUF1697 domain-containing protein n=1 Tax=Pediococcus inopinatus TaxID=114090 RepID=UPI0009E804CE|nr:DUF1697 domain-containing protein [Pediococcus inopinatus]AVL00993.1 hypothetical protein PI20285_10260 [Pediococcus inopinatus]